MPTAEGALQRLCDPEAKVSAHYTIDEDGTVYRHVPEARRAWHAGVSYWAGERDINARSIGIEIVNPGHEFGYCDFPEAQIAALIVLAQGIVRRNPIPPKRVLGHSDVAPKRKIDPGEKFPWARLAAAGIGLWPKQPRLDLSRSIQVPEIQRDLIAFGYDCPATGVLDEATRFAISAFQRHFRPNLINGIPDGETATLAAQLARV